MHFQQKAIVSVRHFSLSLLLFFSSPPRVFDCLCTEEANHFTIICIICTHNTRGREEKKRWVAFTMFAQTWKEIRLQRHSHTFEHLQMHHMLAPLRACVCLCLCMPKHNCVIVVILWYYNNTKDKTTRRQTRARAHPSPYTLHSNGKWKKFFFVKYHQWIRTHKV